MNSSEKKKGTVNKMAVLTAKCERVFAVSKEKAKAFAEYSHAEKASIKQEQILLKITKKIEEKNDKT